MATQAEPTAAGRQWFIVGRWQEFEGEGRVNMLRVLALVAFYAAWLLTYLQQADRPTSTVEFHRHLTLLVGGWSLLALGVQVALSRRVFPGILKYVSTVGDLIFLTALVWLGSGPASPLVAVYFAIIAMAGLRFSLGLVRVAALGAMASYLLVVGARDPVWFDAEHVVPVVEQLVTLLSLGLTGIVVGQIVRRVRGIAEDYARRLQAAGGRGS